MRYKIVCRTCNTPFISSTLKKLCPRCLLKSHTTTPSIRKTKKCCVCGGKCIAPFAYNYTCSTRCEQVYHYFLENLGGDEDGHCHICGRRFGRKGKTCSARCTKIYKKLMEKLRQEQEDFDEALLTKPTRKCHECGTPTSNYRCPSCLERWRAKYDIEIDDDVEYHIEVRNED